MASESILLLQTHGEGILLPLLVHPGARKNAVTGVHDGRLKVSVTQAPEKGKANVAVMEVVADALGLKRSQISLHAGETNPRKTLLIQGIAHDDLVRMLAGLAHV